MASTPMESPANGPHRRPLTTAKLVAALPADSGGLAGFDLHEFVAILRRHLLLISATIIGITGAAITYILTAPPLYTADIMVVLDTRKTEVMASPAVLSGLPADSAVVLSEVELLRSPAFAEKVVRELQLVDNPAFIEEAEDPGPLLGALGRAKRFIHDILFVPPASTPEIAAGSSDARKFHTATDQIRARSTITNGGRSYAINISYEDRDPVRAARIMNAFGQIYVRDQLEAKSQALHKANAWMHEQLTMLADRVRDSARAVQMFRAEHGFTETRNGTVLEQQLMQISTRLSEAQADLAQKEAALNEAKSSTRKRGSASVPAVVSSMLIQRLREQEAELIQRRADLATKYGPKHPSISAIEDQLRDLRNKIQIETTNTVDALASEVAAAKSRAAALEDDLHGLQRSAFEATDAAVRLQELQREAEADRNLYQDLLLRSKQTAAQEDIQQPDAHIVGAASTPIFPSHPRKLLDIGVALAVSGIVAAFSAFLADSLDTLLRSSDQVRSATGLPVLGLIPHVRGGWPSAVRAVVDHPVSIFAESIQNVRVALGLNGVLNRLERPRTIALTSSVSGEGKTLIAAALARSLARSGAKTLLVEFDLRRPRVESILGHHAGRVAEASGGGTELVVREDSMSGLHFVPAPRIDRNPQEVLVSEVMHQFLRGARESYDFIIIDTPPVLAVTDALVISHFVDAVIYVVRWARTPRAAVKGGLDLLGAHGAPVAGTILSGVNLRRISRIDKGEWGSHYAASTWLGRSAARTNVY